jgi:hypothetical protein
MMGIDLNTVEEEEDEEEGGPGAGGAVCMELWHACAGPVGPLPRKGSAVVYLPQGHLEHVGEAAGAGPAAPPHVFCRVVDVNLQVRAPCARICCYLCFYAVRERSVLDTLTDRESLPALILLCRRTPRRTRCTRGSRCRSTTR